MTTPKRSAVRRVGSAHAAERRYASNRPNISTKPIIRNVHDFLEYCRLRASVARSVQAIFSAHDNCVLLGYLTGSVGPLIDARMLVEESHPHCVRFAGSIKEWTPAGITPDKYYESVLDDLFENGARHFILADEYVGGGSVDRVLKLTWRWAQSRAASAATFSVVAFADTSSKPDEAFLARVNEYRKKGMPICSARIFRCRVLLEMDEAGKVFNPIRKAQGRPGEYEFHRVQAPIIFQCKTGGPSAMGAPTSADQLFGAFVAWAIGSRKPVPGATWPASIETSNCEDCKGLLCRARAAWQTA